MVVPTDCPLFVIWEFPSVGSVAVNDRLLKVGVLGQDFRRLWQAYAVSSLGTWLALDAFPLIAILALHSSAAQVSLIAAASGAVGALLAVPLGPWIEFRRKRQLMIRADLVRFLVLLTVPITYYAGVLTYLQLLATAVVVTLAVAFLAGFAAVVV
jgi:hypothetical protein